MQQVAGMLCQLLDRWAPESPQITFLKNGCHNLGTGQGAVPGNQLQLPAPAPQPHTVGTQLALPAPAPPAPAGGQQQNGPALAPQTQGAGPQADTQQVAAPIAYPDSSPNAPVAANEAGHLEQYTA